MYLSRPIYELLPYVYIAAGACLLVASWYVRRAPWPTALFVLGLVAIVGGLVLWLRRRDYRTKQSEYTVRSLDD
jgi:NhaP-type Na+/H+ or K+/H+ antiporter